MERETKTIITDSGVEIILKAYATGREAQQIQSVYYRNVKMDMNPKGEHTISDFSPMIQIEAEKEMINQMVVSINGIKEDLINIALNLRDDDYQKILSEINEVLKKK